jgi:hypothetical protein
MSLEATIRSLTVTPSHIPFPIQRPQSAIPHYVYTSSLQRDHSSSSSSSRPPTAVGVTRASSRPMSASLPIKAQTTS